MKLYLLLLTLITFFSCSGDHKKKAFNTSILANQVFQIHTERDTSVQTLHGTIISIPANAFSVAGNVTVEVREAMSPIEMFAAGLTTESNNRPLISGGMIYINASSKNRDVALVKSVKISMPNEYYDPSMQIFKGEQTDSGTINWTSPVQPDTTSQATNFQIGKRLFEMKCTPCHGMFRNLTGPALANVEERGPWHDRKQLHLFVNDPPTYMANNTYTQNLKAQYNGVLMTGFPDLGPEYLNAVFDYIKNESVRPGAREDETKTIDSLNRLWKDRAITDTVGSASAEPCPDDTVYVNTSKPQGSFFDITDTLPAAPVTDLPEQILDNSAKSMEGLRAGFNDFNPTFGRYDFEIRTLGWYNVDAYIEGYAGTTNVKLRGNLQMKVDADMSVYLFCPRNKMLSVIHTGSDKSFYFDKVNGGIPLFLGDRAILFAFGTKGDKIFYGITEFWIQQEQTISITTQETTEEKMQKALQVQKLDGINLGIESKEKKILKNNCNVAYPPQAPAVQ